MFARNAMRTASRLVRGEAHKESIWGPIHFERVNWTGDGALFFSIKNRFAFHTVFWTLSAVFFGLPFYSVERKVWEKRVKAWSEAKANGN